MATTAQALSIPAVKVRRSPGILPGFRLSLAYPLLSPTLLSPLPPAGPALPASPPARAVSDRLPVDQAAPRRRPLPFLRLRPPRHARPLPRMRGGTIKDRGTMRGLLRDQVGDETGTQLVIN